MNKTLKNILFFAVIFLIVNEGVKFYFYQVSINNHRLMKLDENFEAQNETIEFLFLGHSRPAKAINQEIISNSFNYTTSGEDIVKTYYKLKSILDKSTKKYNVIILPLGFPTLSVTYLESEKNSFYWSKYVDYIELGDYTNRKIDYFSYAIKTTLFPYFEYPYIKSKLITGDLNLREDQALFNVSTREVKEILAKKALLMQDKLAETNSPTAVLYLKKILDLGKSKNATLLFVKYPVSRFYKKEAQKYMDNKGVEIYQADSIVASYGYKVLDLENIYSDSLHYFKDAHHLNKKGSKEFSLKMSVELDKLGKD